MPEARGKTEVVDSGVDLERFMVEPAPAGPPRYVCIGSLIERKNVLRLAGAFEKLGEGTLTFVGDGPLRERLEGRPGIELTGALPYDRIPAQIAAAHVVCQPSLIEPFGQAVLEAMACGRSVVATRIGGPPEFVPPEAGVLVDPVDEDALVDALRTAAARPARTPPHERRPKSTTSGVRRRRLRRFSSEPLEVRKPELDERANPPLEACLAGRLQRLLVALAGFRRIDALFEPVVSGDEELLNPLPCVVPLHKSTVTVHIESGTASWRPPSTCQRGSAC